ncbi:MAG: serine/threonine protein kinase, partial [Firmicutes bacterium]|nr:serine/threonine protein kinase [Bacillota bacterium]
MIGKILGGRYQIESSLGEGGMARVFKARDLKLNRIVAVKVLHDHLTGNQDFVRRFRREAQAVAKFSHPSIVSLYDVGEEDNIYYIVMECLQGKTLKELIKQEGKLSAEDAVEIACQVCDALVHAHRQN